MSEELDCCNTDTLLTSLGGSTGASPGAGPMGSRVCATGTCCVGRSGSREISGKMQSRNVRYGRPIDDFIERIPGDTHTEANLWWENYYFNGRYRCQLDWTAGSPPSGPGVLTVTVRVRAVPYTMQPDDRALQRIVGADNLRPMTTDEITTEVNAWQAMIDKYWNKDAYVIVLRDNRRDCLVPYTVNFQITKASGGADRTIDMVRAIPSSDWRGATLTVAQKNTLNIAWRSNAGKINMRDRRETLIPHEYGHWIGWPDEYLEIDGRVQGGNTLNGFADIGGGTMQRGAHLNRRHNLRNFGPLYEKAHHHTTPKNQRVRMEFDNPTLNYRAANGGSGTQSVDLLSNDVYHGFMASGVNTALRTRPRLTKNAPRYLYSLAEEFRRAYGGNTDLIDVLVS